MSRAPGWLDLNSWLQRLFNPVDIASLVFFRIFFGVIAFWHVWIQMPEVHVKYIAADFHFKYYGFEWVKPLPGELMTVVFLVMAAAAIFIAFGLFYRYAAFVFFATHSYVLLIDRAVAWNHYYLISLIAFLLIFVPAHRAFSLDVARGAVSHSDDAPAWSLWLLRAQMGIVYFFAGFAKLSSHDWILHAQPMKSFLAGDDEFPLIGRWLTEDWAAWVASYAGMFFDLLILPLLLWPRTRWPALVLALGFHLSNSLLFNIQVFPWLALVATLLFLNPDWPRLGGQWRRLSQPVASGLRATPARLSRSQAALAALLGLYFLVQLLLPLRHFVYEGNAEWTRAGHFFAWRMLLIDFQREYAFFLTSSEDPESICKINQDAYVYGFQAILLDHPDAMVQFAHYVKDQYEARGASGIEVHAWVNVAFNGRTPRALVDPEVDLASVGHSLGPYDWVIALEDAEFIEPPEAERCPDPISLDRLRQIDVPR